MINISKNIGKGRVNLLCYQEDKNNLDGSPMKIQEIEITDIGGIPYLKLDNLDSRMNIICGENGVGKTNILNVLAFLFTDYDDIFLKKREGAARGNIDISYEKDRETQKYWVPVDSFDPGDTLHQMGGEPLHSKFCINMKVNRVFDYRVQDSIKKDPDVDYYNQKVIAGSSADNLKQWFISRDLHGKAGNLEYEQNHNINLARNLISKLDEKFTFKKTTTENEIIIKTPSGEIYFEYLSSGFKSSFFILIGIIKEIEYKYGKDLIRADEYDGVILIDEVELHLHPEWQARIIKILKESFPKAQFFITTHSPHVVQSAQHNEIIALEKTNAFREGVPFEVLKRDLPDSPEYGFQGWTIEEVLTDVMGMKNTRGEAYEAQIGKFDAALEDNDKERAQEAYLELEKMLHPHSHVRKMLQLEMVGLE